MVILLTARYIPGEKNVLADQLIRSDQVFLTEWSLHRRVFEAICREYNCPLFDLFAARADMRLPLFVCPECDPMAWKENGFQFSWDDLSDYAFLLFALPQQILPRLLIFQNLFMNLVASLWPRKEWFADLLSLLVDIPLELPMPWNLLVHPRAEVSQGSGVTKA